MKTLIEAYLRAYNAKDVDGMMTVLHEDILFENITNATGAITLTGKRAFRKQAEQVLPMFSTRTQVIHSLVVQGNLAAAEISYQATVAQDLPNGWKASQEIALRGVSIFAGKDGKICRISDYS